MKPASISSIVDQDDGPSHVSPFDVLDQLGDERLNEPLRIRRVQPDPSRPGLRKPVLVFREISACPDRLLCYSIGSRIEVEIAEHLAGRLEDLRRGVPLVL